MRQAEIGQLYRVCVGERPRASVHGDLIQQELHVCSLSEMEITVGVAD